MNTKKLALALFPLLLAFASCMNIDGSNGKEGAIRVTFQKAVRAELIHFQKIILYMK